MEDPYLKSNKEGNRPHCYCFKEDATGVYWMILLLSRVEKYRKIIENKEKTGKPCDILHSVFLIEDMFPITDAYIEREYTIAGNHLMLTSEHSVKEIEKKLGRLHLS